MKEFAEGLKGCGWLFLIWGIVLSVGQFLIGLYPFEQWPLLAIPLGLLLRSLGARKSTEEYYQQRRLNVALGKLSVLEQKAIENGRALAKSRRRQARFNRWRDR
ncbi:UNVERIFIED_ORG: hypothetical protein ABID57_000656 [Arthrobacter sp. UYEF1]